MQTFQNKTAVITGAASGIGRELAVQLARKGCRLALVDVNEAGLDDTGKLVARNVFSLHIADISCREKVELAAKEILARHERIDLLVNNAGISVSSYFANMSLDDFEAVIRTNLLGSVYYTKAFLPSLLANPAGGHVVNVISGFAMMGFPGKTAYAASKGALLAFSNVLYTELYDTKVRVSVVIPPAIDTNLVRDGKAGDALKKEKEIAFLREKGMSAKEAVRRMIRGIEKGRYRIRIGGMTWAMDVAGRLFPTLTHRLIGRWKHKMFVQ